MNSFMSKIYQLKGKFNIDDANSVQFKPPSETKKIITILKQTKHRERKVLVLISTSGSNIKSPVSFRHIYTQVLSRHCYVWIGSTSHRFKFFGSAKSHIQIFGAAKYCFLQLRQNKRKIQIAKLCNFLSQAINISFK